MKRFVHRLIRKYCLLPFVALGGMSCQQPGEEVQLAHDLARELEHINAQEVFENKRWMSKDAARFTNGYFSAADLKVLENLGEKIRVIQAIVKDMNRLEQSITGRYATDAVIVDSLTSSEKTIVGEILASFGKDVKPVVKGNDHFYVETVGFYFVEYHNNPDKWREILLIGKPVYSAMLQLELAKKYLMGIAEKLKVVNAQKMGTNDYFRAIHLNLLLESDSSQPALGKKAIVFMQPGTIGFSILGGTYPLSFTFNGKKQAMRLEGADLVSEISIPTSPTTGKSPTPVVKNWKASWVISLSPYRDTTIHFSGQYIIKPNQ